MKRFKFIILTLTLLLSQMGTLDHVYSEHKSGEVCDFCISVPSLDNALTNSSQTHVSINTTQQHVILAQALHSTNSLRYYAARAPPRLI